MEEAEGCELASLPFLLPFFCSWQRCWALTAFLHQWSVGRRCMHCNLRCQL